MGRRSRRPAPMREDARMVLVRALNSRAQVAIHLDIPGGSLRVTGLVRALDDRHVEVVEGERVRRLPLSRVVEARAVPERHEGTVTGAIEKAWGERW